MVLRRRALRARAPLLGIKTTHSDVLDGFPTIALLLVVAVFYNKNVIIYNVIRKAAVS